MQANFSQEKINFFLHPGPHPPSNLKSRHCFSTKLGPEPQARGENQFINTQGRVLQTYLNVHMPVEPAPDKKNGWEMKDLEAEMSEIPIFLLIL
ncbi:MAG: hypothetical protein MRZ38_02470 [Muribaculaceae bacterium]|nr:hypothetical protein [Muribaculaceae bacterium]